ncbi:MAG TPA: hypothetical protein DEQ02_10405 [Ruminococcaceae bacterium]|nr:hypothetical protein [Oscillospiraceae bacterium]
MRANNGYTQAIAQAKANLADLNERGGDAIGWDALEFMQGLLAPEEVAASNLRAAMMVELDKGQAEGNMKNLLQTLAIAVFLQ